MIVRVLPLLLIAWGLYAGVERAKPLLSFPDLVAQESELNAIAQVMVLDSVSGALPRPDTFHDYIRRSLVTKIPGRDMASDRWGTPYKLEMKTRTAFIVSAGPDKSFETSDDIRKFVKLNL